MAPRPKAALIGLGLAALGLAAAPAALADPSPVDGRFLAALDQVQIQHPNDAAALDTARNVCRRISDGFTIKETVDELAEANPGLSTLKAGHFIAVARVVYCPQATEVRLTRD